MSKLKLEQKKKELEEKFETIKKEMVILEQAYQQKTQELLRLQGEWRLLEKLNKESE